MSDATVSWRLYFRRGCSIVLVSVFMYVVLAYVGFKRPLHNEITIYAYSDMLSPEVFKPFENRTGIRVNIKYFEAVEELITKLVFTQEEGVDLIAPTDSMVEMLRHEHLLVPLDKSRLSCVDELDERLLGKFYDSEDHYSLPFTWSPIGIGYNTRVISVAPSHIKWDLIFGKKTADGVQSPSQLYHASIDKVCLGEDPWETLFLAAFHKYGGIQNLTDQRLRSLVLLLRNQKRWLECYTNNLKYFLISGVSPAVVMPAAYFVAIRDENPWVEFAIPERGSLIIIGEVAIPRVSKKKKLAHQVIDYLISQEGGLACFNEHAYNPANRYAYSALPTWIRRHQYVLPRGQYFKRLKVGHNQIPLKRVEQMWYEIKV